MIVSYYSEITWKKIRTGLVLTFQVFYIYTENCTLVSGLISINNLNKSESSKTWDKLETEDQKERKRKVKNQFNLQHSKSLKKATFRRTQYLR